MSLKPKSKNQSKEMLAINKELQDEIEQNWLSAEEEGELSVDIYQDENNVYVTSTVAGVKPENLEISVNNDLLTIRGFRQHGREIDQREYFLQECFWGRFSRSIILPVEVATDRISAELEDGVLTIILPKLKRSRNIPIKIK
ncbi:MAG: hypothetical protein A2731_00650 [Candidatus Buchananbacteria bacterium RIFCSPHIGHO2_01_FULL_39_8]|uniref:SHSP domain-containing protein n=1 Tax=Candidatus Buchananbacteria bacterium RIFCSPHIGHO2_01_FULL_39_8 TaxID=1797533 RepID=A0A1G1XTQ8_9BACT|nr:MAG: hypothetical protein A2731_00650 [Candidatus Buchananbacteria bacterium RIFCSPHIGHO2_01_FULL_39_8]